MAVSATNRWTAYWLAVAALAAAGGAMLLAWTPVERTMGPIQKIFYLHVPLAVNALLACAVVCVGSVGYLWKRRPMWDELAGAAGKTAVLLCSGVLLTGMIWARGAWGHWWTWHSPKLLFSLLLWMLYVAYVVLRVSIESPPQRRAAAGVYGVVAFLDVPLVWLSARLIPDIHPASVELTGPMKLTLAVWFVPVTLLTAGLIARGLWAARRQQPPEPSAETSAPAVGHGSDARAAS